MSTLEIICIICIVIVVIILAKALYDFFIASPISNFEDARRNEPDFDEPTTGEEIHRFVRPIATQYLADIDRIQRNPTQRDLTTFNHTIDVVRTFRDNVEDRLRGLQVLEDAPELQHLLLMDFATIRGNAIKAAANVTTTLEEKIVWPEDTQNVHDSTVVDSTSQAFNRLKTLTTYDSTKDAQTLRDILAYASSSTVNKKQNAISALNAMTANTKIMGLGGAREMEILSRVWNRINSPENAGNIDNLKESLIISMADGSDHGVTVCSMGRVSRAIESLSHVDVDPNVGIIVDTTTLRNSAFMRAGKIRDEVLSTEELRAQYDSGSEDLDNTIKNEIATVLHREFSMMRPDDLRNVIEECQSVV